MKKSLITYTIYLLLLLGGLSIQQQLQAANITRPNIRFGAGIFVNSYTGNLFYQRKDMKLAGFGPNLPLSFTYNASNHLDDLGFGFGWTFSYNLYYEVDSLRRWVVRGDGRRDLYVPATAGFAPPPGVFDAFEEYQAGKYRLSTPDGIAYYFEDSTHRRLTRIRDSNGNEVHLSYVNSQLSEITNAIGLKIKISWQANHVAELKELNFGQRKWMFTYNREGYLLGVINPMGEQETYDYNTEGQLIRITQVDGNAYLCGYFDGNVVAELVSCDRSHYFTYDVKQKKTYTVEGGESENVVTVYEFDQKGNLIRKRGNCCGYDMGYAYDGDLNLTRIVDANGHVTTFAFDQEGNKLSETDPLGGIRQWQYIPGTNKVSQEIDKNGSIKSFVYDTAFNLIQIIYPLGLTENFVYDTKGQLTQQISPGGNIIRYVYDSLGNMTRRIAPHGKIKQYVYDNRGNVIQEIDPLNNSFFFTYDLLDRLISVTDPLGNVSRKAYDEKGRVIKEWDAQGDSSIYTYSAMGRLIQEDLPGGVVYKSSFNKRGNKISETDPLGRKTLFRYNKRNQKVAETDAYGNTSNFVYDAVGNLIQKINALGDVWTYVYDANRRLIEEINYTGHAVTYSYDPAGNLTSQTDPKGNVTSFSYDALGRKIKETDVLGNETTYQFDSNSNLIKTIDPLGRVTAWVYDSLNRTTAIISPALDTTHIVFDLNNNILSYKNARGKVTLYAYDALNRQIYERDAVGNEEKYYYDAVGQNIRIETVGSNVHHHEFDQAGNLLSIRDTLGYIQKFTYDKAGNLLTETDERNQIYAYTYDALNRLVEGRDPAGKSVTFRFDALSREIEEIDRRGKAYSFEYDALNRIISETNALQATTRYTYDENGNLTQLTDHLGRNTNFVFDASNRLIKEIYPDNSQVNFSYDALSRLKSKSNRNGITTFYNYNINSRMIEKIHPGNKRETFSYDANGNILSATNDWASLSFTYDDIDQRLTETLNGKTTSYVYGPTFDNLEISYPGGKKIVETYDQRSRIQDIKMGSKTLASFSYGLDDKVTQLRYGNGLNTNITYNSLGLVTSLDHGNFVRENNVYDENSNLLTVEKLHRPSDSRKYVYDDFEQLIQEKKGVLTNGQIPNPTKSHQLLYDLLGNRTTMTIDTTQTTYQIDNRNSYLAVGSQFLSYDPHGNLIHDGQKSYQYDAENRLISVSQGATTLVTYGYDPLGRRSHKVVGSDTTQYFYSFNDVIEERDENDNILAIYVTGRGIDELIFAELGGQEMYYHTDIMGSVQAISNAQGRVVEYYDYDAFGAMVVMDSMFQIQNVSQFANPYGFTGRRFEAETGLIYIRNRYYSPALGRFIQPDPLGYIDSPNLYQYAYNDPGSYLDPMGLSTSFHGKSVADRILEILPRREFAFSGSLTLWVIPTPIGPVKVDMGLSIGAFACCNEKNNEINLALKGEVSIGFSRTFGIGAGDTGEEDRGFIPDVFKGKNGKGGSKPNVKGKKRNKSGNGRNKKVAGKKKKKVGGGKKGPKSKTPRKNKRRKPRNRKDKDAKQPDNPVPPNPDPQGGNAFKDNSGAGFTGEIKKVIGADDLPTCPEGLAFNGSVGIEVYATAGFFFTASAFASVTVPFTGDVEFAYGARYGISDYIGAEFTISVLGKGEVTGTLPIKVTI